MLAYQNQDIKILENSFLAIPIEMAENTLCLSRRKIEWLRRKHTLFSIQITIFASTSFLGGLWNGRYEMHQPNVNRPFLSIHIIVYFISYYTLLSDHLYSHPLPRLFLFVHLPICHKHNDLTHTCREVRRSD